VSIRAGALLLLLLTAGCARPVLGHAGAEAALPRIGPAPDFDLTAQDGRRFSLADLRGTVAAVTFIYTSCADTCPLLTAKMAQIQRGLGADFGPYVQFVSITVDPERDTPEALTAYSAAYGADLTGWTFLTGTPLEILEVSRRYGIYSKKTRSGEVDHTFLTSLLDREGTLRVQYLGTRFDPDEMRRDLLALVREGQRR
jgi:protein SCO1/2